MDGAKLITNSHTAELTPDSSFSLKKIIQSIGIKNIYHYIPKITKFTFWGITLKRKPDFPNSFFSLNKTILRIQFFGKVVNDFILYPFSRILSCFKYEISKLNSQIFYYKSLKWKAFTELYQHLDDSITALPDCEYAFQYETAVQNIWNYSKAITHKSLVHNHIKTASDGSTIIGNKGHSTLTVRYLYDVEQVEKKIIQDVELSLFCHHCRTTTIKIIPFQKLVNYIQRNKLFKKDCENCQYPPHRFYIKPDLTQLVLYRGYLRTDNYSVSELKEGVMCEQLEGSLNSDQDGVWKISKIVARNYLKNSSRFHSAIMEQYHTPLEFNIEYYYGKKFVKLFANNMAQKLTFLTSNERWDTLYGDSIKKAPSDKVLRIISSNKPTKNFVNNLVLNYIATEAGVDDRFQELYHAIKLKSKSTSQ